VFGIGYCRLSILEGHLSRFNTLTKSTTVTSINISIITSSSNFLAITITGDTNKSQVRGVKRGTKGRSSGYLDSGMHQVGCKI